MIPLTDIVKKLLFLNIAIYIIATMLLPNVAPGLDLGMKSPFLFDSSANLHYNPNFKPYSIVTHMFMHSTTDMGHLFSNMLGLFFFGPYVERALGEKRFVILYFVAGFVAMLFHFVANYFMVANNGAVGASGAISGVLFAFITMNPQAKLQLIFPPVPVKAIYLGLAFFLIDLFREYSGSNISGFAHIGGAIAGILLILYWRKSNFR